MLQLATAYIILRPFFGPSSEGGSEWLRDMSSAFPGSEPKKAQELNERTHPHLQLGRSMVSIPRVQPGDQVYCAYLDAFRPLFSTKFLPWVRAL